MEGAIVFGALCTIMDCAFFRIEKWLIYIGAAAGAAWTGCRIWQGKQDWYSVILSLLPGGILWALAAVSEGKIGRGDGDMVAVLGLFMGWEKCVAALCIACLFAAVFAGAGLAAGKYTKSSKLPFAPFLLVAVILLRIFLPGGA